MKHLLILISFLLLSSPLFGQSLNGFFETKMVEMLSFVSKNCGKIDGIHPNHDPCNYNFKIRLPKVEIKSAEYIQAEVNVPYDFKAVYNSAKETIYLRKTWRKNKNSDLGLLMHELYHHLQHLNGDSGKDKCSADVETPAYKVQTAYHKIELDEWIGDENFLENAEKQWMEFLALQVLGQGVKCINKTLYKWYKGEYKDGKFHGQGTFNYPFGTIYKGKWKDGNKQGKGTLTFTNGNKYVGNWKDNKKNGQGTFTWANGNKYEGEWKDEKRTGQGTFTWANGDKYEGEWKDGKRTGQGKYIFSNGGKVVGEFRGGKYWNTKEYDKEGNIIRTWVNGKGIKP